jgi:hypothetical protein
VGLFSERRGKRRGLTKVDLRDALFEVFEQLDERGLFMDAWGDRFYGEREGGYIEDPERWVRDSLKDSSLWQYLDAPWRVTAEYDPETANYDKPKKWSIEVLGDIVEVLHRDAVAVSQGPDQYDQDAGRQMFRDAVNPVLAQAEPPLVLTEAGEVVEVADADKTSIIEAIVQKPKPGGGTTPGLTDEIYDHILGIVASLVRGMEVTPGTYRKLDEEERRNILLNNLNTHYKDAAAGEAFNFGGKTDLLVRHEGDNVFIGECKNWDGPETLKKALAQLFGYTAWRDTKLALVTFVPNVKFSDVVAAAKKLVEEHDQFIAWREDPADDTLPLRAVMHWPGDENRHVDVAVFLVHLPE